MPGGDVLVGHGSRVETFFAGTRYPSVEAAFDSKVPPSDTVRRIPLQDGTFVQGIGSGRCRGGLGPVVEITDSQGRQQLRAAYLVLVDHPVQRVADVCEEEEQPAWESRVVVVEPGGLLALADGTFLVVDLISGTALRLPRTLRVDPRMTRVRSVDPDVLERGARKFPAKSSYGIDWPAYFEQLRQTYFGTNAAGPCATQRNTLEINACAKQNLDRAEEELNATYKAALALLSAPDGLGRKQDAIRQQLVEAQRDWVTFREKNCDAVLLKNADGTIRTYVYLSCRQQLAEDRTKELSLWFLRE